MNHDKLSFARTLKDIRLKIGLSQEDLADISFININTISRMENGKDSYDFDKLETLSNIYDVDLIEIYFNTFYNDSNKIDNIIDSINKKDRVNGIPIDNEIDKLNEIKEKSKRKVIRNKAEKLILFLKSIEEDNPSKRKKLLLEALQFNRNFSLENLSNNYYDNIDYRILMNYAHLLKRPADRLRIYDFIEKSDLSSNSLRALLYQNMAIDYYILDQNDEALEYINRALDSSSKSSTSPVMFYTKALILEDMNLDYEPYIKKALKIAKIQDEDIYYTILSHWENRTNK